jgi:hypothetical protein
MAIYPGLSFLNSKNQTSYKFTGSNYYLFIVALPFTGFIKNNFNYTFSINGTYIVEPDSLTWYESNKGMIIAVSVTGILIIIFIVTLLTLTK